MKIIERGDIPEKDKYPKRKKCYYCNTIFDYDRSDIKSDIRNGDYVECPLPQCKKFIDVSENDPTSAVDFYNR